MDTTIPLGLKEVEAPDDLSHCLALERQLQQARLQEQQCSEIISLLQERERELTAWHARLRAISEAAEAELSRCKGDRLRAGSLADAGAPSVPLDAARRAVAPAAFPVPLVAPRFDAGPPGSLDCCPPASLPACRYVPECRKTKLIVGRPVGLPNRSSDCFWLATMQSLRHTPGFCAAMSSSVVPSERPVATLGEAVAGLLKAMEKAEPSGHVELDCPALGEFYFLAMKELGAPAAGGKKLVQWEAGDQRQQDAHEFLSQLLTNLGGHLPDCERPSPCALGDSKRLESLERELTEAARVNLGAKSRETKSMARQNAYNLLYEYSVLQWAASGIRMQSRSLSAIFEGQRLTSISCGECGRFAASEAEPFTMEEVRLGPPAEDPGWLAQLGNLFSDTTPPKPTLADLLRRNAERSAPEGYKCPNQRCRCVGKSLRTMRFLRLPATLVVHVNRSRPDGSRCGLALDFERALDLADLGLVADFGRPVDRDWEPCGTRYQLISAVFHQGSTARSGHYFAYVFFGGCWVCLNDNSVAKAQMTPMELEASESTSGPRVALLFYQRVDD